VVNGIGEGKESDIGIVGGRGVGLLFRGGEIIRKVPQEALEAVLIEEVENLVASRSRHGLRR
jgi:(E)-4-hydroxy-3-methylbut-2-enyl-diphosphate synthase